MSFYIVQFKCLSRKTNRIFEAINKSRDVRIFFFHGWIGSRFDNDKYRMPFSSTVSAVLSPRQKEASLAFSLKIDSKIKRLFQI
jgi:hypothetical protein